MSRAGLVIAVGITAVFTVPGEASGQKDARQILDAYVADFRSDPAAEKAITFGIRVSGEGGGDWHVVVTGDKKEGSKAKNVSLKDGFPQEPCVYYTTDLATLRRIDAGELNALTAMAKAFSTDAAPMDISATDGFTPPNEDFFTKEFIPFTFHFWTRGFPEIVPFGGDLTRPVHGAHASVLYYEKGLRSAWAQIRKGDHVNADPRSQTNPFPSMLIVLSGEFDGKIDGRPVVLRKGQMLFIPPGVTHEFWNENDESAECVLLMFGEGA